MNDTHAEADDRSVDYRAHPELYRVGKGEQGVLTVEPYKSEILPHWRFRTPALARVSAREISELFAAYLRAGDFVGADMARKFLQMGFTRARRYANHPSGRKYDPRTGREGPRAADALTSDKAEAARIFYDAYAQARDNATYRRLRAEHLSRERRDHA